MIYPIGCFITDNGLCLIDEKVKEFSKDSNVRPILSTIPLGVKIHQKNVYSLDDVINNLKPRFIK